MTPYTTATHYYAPFSPSSACWTCCAAGGSEDAESSAWGHRAPAVDGRGAGRGASWDEAPLNFAAAADEEDGGGGAAPVCDVDAAAAAGGVGADAGADGKTGSRDEEAGKQEDRASDPGITDKKKKGLNKQTQRVFLK